MRAPIATLILLSLLTFTVGLGRQAIGDGDEGFYAEAAREMVESGDWLTPHFNYTDRWQKPILYYWVAAATYGVAGVSEWGARGFSALSGLALVLLTYGVGRRLLGRQDAAWLGAAIVATCYGYFTLARLALPDLPLALFVSLTIFLWLERRPALAGIAAALGFLDKGPLALALPALVLLPIWWRERRWPGEDQQTPVSLHVRDLAVGGLVFAAIALPWYAAMVLQHGTPYLESFFIGDNLERFATDRFNEPRPIWFYAPILIGGIFPWTAFLLVLPWRRIMHLVKRTSRLNGAEWRLLIWTLAPLLFFTASVGKQPRYILPVLPPLALLLGASIVKRLKQGRQGTTRRELEIATWGTASIYFLLAALLFRAGPILINALPAATLLAGAALVVAGTVAAVTAATARWDQLPGRMAASAAVALLAVHFGALAGSRPEAVETVAQIVLANRSETDEVATYRVLERNLVFYTGVRQLPVYDDTQALAVLGSEARVLLVARASDVRRLQDAMDTPLKALGAVDYVDPAAIRLSTLLSPDPREAITTLLVVANR